MKIALVTDTHFGARSDSAQFDSYFKRFYNDIFFPELDKRGIKDVIHLGDCFDRRKYINFNSLKSCREYFFEQLTNRGIHMDMIVGNHDTFFKNTNDVNSPELLLGEYPNLTTYDKAEIVSYDGLKILLMPWICADNWEHASKLIQSNISEVCFGHLELAGFVMFKGQDAHIDHSGLDPTIFKDYKLVCSGHFHHKHGKGNVEYLGNPYQLFWNDFEDDRGFHIFDTKTLQLEFIKNPYTIFEKYYYDDEKEDPLTIDPSRFSSKLIKIIVVNKKDFYKFDKFIEAIYKENPIEVKIIEDFSEFETEALDESIDLEDTMTLLSNYVDGIETDADKERLKGILRALYVEAQHYEEV
jgi:UDP-2,3-diacylglucosamine pyrophosphatase LpxH